MLSRALVAFAALVLASSFVSEGRAEDPEPSPLLRNIGVALWAGGVVHAAGVVAPLFVAADNPSRGQPLEERLQPPPWYPPVDWDEVARVDEHNRGVDARNQVISRNNAESAEREATALRTAGWVNVGVAGGLFLVGMTLFAAGQGQLDVHEERRANPAFTPSPALRNTGIGLLIAGAVLGPAGAVLMLSHEHECHHGPLAVCIDFEDVAGPMALALGGAALLAGAPLVAAGSVRVDAGPTGARLAGAF